jgi:hypothetical protein
MKWSAILLAIMPVCVFVPFFIGSRLISKGVPGWVDWMLVIACAGLVILNPWVRHIEYKWMRGIAFVAGFFGWNIALSNFVFIIMAVVFQDGL